MTFKELLFQYKWVVGGFAVLTYVLKEYISYNRLRHFKGPPGAAISNWWHTKAFLSGRCHEYYGDANERYGPIARVAPNLLMTSSPELWAYVNGVRSGYKRSIWYYGAARLEHGRDNIFSQTNDELHDARRKQMAAGYAGKENLNLEANIDIILQRFLHLIRSKYLSSSTQARPVDLAEKVQFFTMDVISTVGLGKSFGMLEVDADPYGYIQSVEEGLAIANTTAPLGLWWLTRVPVLGKFLAPNPTDQRGFGKMMATAFAFVDERAANPTDKRSDMLASFIRHGLTGADLRTEALEQVVAGSDTTSSAIRGTMLHILTSPRVFAKLRAEADAAAVPPDAIISTARAKELPYLQAVIREGLRVFPPVADPLPRDVPPGGDTVEVEGQTYFLPAGAQVGYSAVAMHRDRRLYGEDAKCFRPERWIEEEDPEKLAAMVRTNELTFGHGKFSCLGKPVAQIEIGKVVFELIRNFDWTISDPQKPWEAINYLGLFVIHAMWVQITPRE